MMKTVLLASAAALAVTVSGAAFGSGVHLGLSAKVSGIQVSHAPRGLSTLYDQTTDPIGFVFVSDDFDSGAMDSSDDQGADDFTVPKGATWTVKEVDVIGRYFANGALTTGAADGENVTFYTGKGKPGTIVKSFTNLQGTDDGQGDFTIPLGRKGVKLTAGHYWVAVQIRTNPSVTGSFWGWADSEVKHKKNAVWENPGDGFGSGCTKWEPLSNCFTGGGPDFSFTLRGKSG
jgi:hypothetical protein